MPSDELRDSPSQRALAQQFGISLGKLNYCLNILITEEWISARTAASGT